MSKKDKKVENKDKDTLLRNFYESQFNFRWESQKINYETREKLLRMYIAVLSILPALLMISYKLKIPGFGKTSYSLDHNQYLLLAFSLFIIFSFSLVTFIRNISLRRSIVKHRKNIAFITRELLEIVIKDDISEEFKNILKGIDIPLKYSKEPKCLDFRNADNLLIISFGFITALAFGFLIFILIDNLNLLFCLCRETHCVLIISSLILLIILLFYMFIYFYKCDRNDIEKKIQIIKTGYVTLEEFTEKEKKQILKTLNKSLKKEAKVQKKREKQQQSDKHKCIEKEIEKILKDNN